MNLKVIQPAGMVLETAAAKLLAEGEHGHFSILPRHADAVAALATGILEVTDDQGQQMYLAVNGGILVKVGDELLVSTPQAVRSEELSRLREVIEEQFNQVDERERKARTAMARIEAGLMHKFMEL